VLGYHEGEDLVDVGKVGTGFGDRMLRDLQKQLPALEVEHAPCTRGRLPTSGVHWVRPEPVGEVAFNEWTRAGPMRHPRFLGLRRDKNAEDVVREVGG
jgi:ATP-dependent DNA ligase